MKLYNLIFLFFLSGIAFGQEKCSCPDQIMRTGDPEGTQTTIKFNLTNGSKLGIRGFQDISKKDTTYTGLTLFNRINNHCIAYWSELQICSVKKVIDTLIVTEQCYLPLGKNFSYLYIPFKDYKFYGLKSGIKNTITLRHLPKYNTSQIDACIKEYNKLKKGNDENTIEIAERLFSAYLSGSTKAKEYFLSIHEKFGPFDGAVAEEWNYIWELYTSYNKLPVKQTN